MRVSFPRFSLPLLNGRLCKLRIARDFYLVFRALSSLTTILHSVQYPRGPPFSMTSFFCRSPIRLIRFRSIENRCFSFCGLRLNSAEIAERAGKMIKGKSEAKRTTYGFSRTTKKSGRPIERRLIWPLHPYLVDAIWPQRPHPEALSGQLL